MRTPIRSVLLVLVLAVTMDDYAAIVDRETFEANIVSRGTKPYWSTNGPDGTNRWVSYSGDDEVAPRPTACRGSGWKNFSMSKKIDPDPRHRRLAAWTVPPPRSCSTAPAG